MIKNFLLERTEKYDERYFDAKQIDTETGAVKLYKINIGSVNAGGNYPYNEYETNINAMGYSSAEEVVKHYELLGTLGHEVKHDRQRAEEIGGYLHLAKFRHDTGRKLLNIADNLKKYYGLSEEYVNKILDYITNHNIERHTIRINKADGDSITTEINGTVQEIISQYSDPIEFIA